MRNPGRGWRWPVVAALVGAGAAMSGCGSEPACPAAGAPGGVGISAVDGTTDAQGKADLAAKICLGSTCRTATLAGEPNRRGALVAGFVDLPLASGDATTLTVTLARGQVTTAGPFDVQVHPILTGAPGASASGASGASGASSGAGCAATTAYVASVVIDVMGAHEGPPPEVPGHS